MDVTKTTRDRVFAVRANKDEARDIVLVARAKGLTVSDAIRGAMRREADELVWPELRP